MKNNYQQDMQTLLRTFGKRQGRKLNQTKQKYLKTTLSDFLLHDSQLNPNLNKNQVKDNQKNRVILGTVREPKNLDFNDIWEQKNKQEDVAGRKRILEVGFGSGERMLQRLLQDDCYFIGSEVYSNGVASCISEIMRGGRVAELKARLRIYPDDIRLLLPDLAAGLFDEVAVFFPDPWPKKRHGKRRLLQSSFLDAIERVLKRDGELQIASDHEGVMQWMLEELINNGWQLFNGQFRGVQNGDDLQSYRAFPEGWTITRYQAKALKEGRASYFARAQKR